MAKINLDPQSEQSILNMLLDHSVLNDSAVSKIVNTSKEIGKTKIETAIELKLTDEQKILKILSSSYSLDIVDLNEKKIDEDEYLQNLDLEALENNVDKLDPNALENVNEFEVNNGKKFAEQDLNEKENPYGLTEYDLEEIDELLNTETK